VIELPSLALAVRQPWAWAIIHAGKPLENRSQGAVRHLVPLTGLRAIHASAGMTRDEYEEGRDFMATLGVKCPAPADLLRGGIIGTVQVTGVIKESDSPWFFGPRALVLTDPKPCELVPVVGALGYFRWKRADQSVVPTPARWMLKAAAPDISPRPTPPSLFDGIA
jgi:hypothetical protein